MTGQEFAGIVRAILAAIGGYFVGTGVIDGETVAALAGAGATIGAAVWSLREKRRQPKAPDA